MTDYDEHNYKEFCKRNQEMLERERKIRKQMREVERKSDKDRVAAGPKHVSTYVSRVIGKLKKS